MRLNARGFCKGRLLSADLHEFDCRNSKASCERDPSAIGILLQEEGHGICLNLASVLNVRATIGRKEAELGKDSVHVTSATPPKSPSKQDKTRNPKETTETYKDPTHHGFWIHPSFGPWGQNVVAFSLCVVFRAPKKAAKLLYSRSFPGVLYPNCSARSLYHSLARSGCQNSDTLQ